MISQLDPAFSQVRPAPGGFTAVNSGFAQQAPSVPQTQPHPMHPAPKSTSTPFSSTVPATQFAPINAAAAPSTAYTPAPSAPQYSAPQHSAPQHSAPTTPAAPTAAPAGASGPASPPTHGKDGDKKDKETIEVRHNQPHQVAIPDSPLHYCPLLLFFLCTHRLDRLLASPTTFPNNQHPHLVQRKASRWI